jgi:hypothetical protein
LLGGGNHRPGGRRGRDSLSGSGGQRLGSAGRARWRFGSMLNGGGGREWLLSGGFRFGLRSGSLAALCFGLPGREPRDAFQDGLGCFRGLDLLEPVFEDVLNALLRLVRGVGRHHLRSVSARTDPVGCT